MLVSLHELKKNFGSKSLFDGLSFFVEEREKIGLIGPNGAGKSTLLKLIAGVEPSDGGSITISRGKKVSYVGQLDKLKAEHTVLESLAESLSGGSMSEVEIETKVAMVASILDFKNPNQSIAELSGGWRKRVLIGRALVQDPDLLLLDEPTNHMDWEAIKWLTGFLKKSIASYVVVTHDRSFLENSTNRIVEINSLFKGGFYSYKGNYSKYLEKKADYIEAQRQSQASMSNKLRREVEWLRKSPQARTTKSRSRMDAAYDLSDQLDEVKVRNSSIGNSANLEFVKGEKSSRKLVEVKGATKSYNNKILFNNLNLLVGPKECIGVLGLNGSGKSTFLKSILGKVELDSGLIELSSKLKIVYFDQKREQLNPKQTLMDFLTGGESDHVIYRGQSIHCASYARKFLFRVEQFNMKLENLSGGEQARLLLARLMLKEADLLILDEPTNDLDIETLGLLESSLAEFQGGVLVVSHDRYFLESVCSDFLALEGDGNWNLYPDFYQWEQRAFLIKSSVSKSGTKVLKEKKINKKRLSYNEQRELSSMEDNISKAELALEKAQVKLEDPEVMASTEKLNECICEVGHRQERVDFLFERWAELEDKLSGESE